MLTYAEAIADFSSALQDSAHVPLCLSEASAAQIDIYRNNVRLNRINALPSAFPMVAELVGDEFFTAMARVYVRTTPAVSANLHEDGSGFAAFIAGFEPAQPLPYLADAARLDWARHLAYYAADVPPLGASELALLVPEKFADLQFAFDPAVALVQSSRWPIADFLKMHQGGPAANLDTGGQAVLIWRTAGQVLWQATAAADAHLLGQLLAGLSLGAALATATEDPNPLLAHLFSHGLVTHIKDAAP